MEQQRVTHHSWQSMKCRYKDRLAKKQPEVVKVESTEKQEGNKAEEDDTKVKLRLKIIIYQHTF